VRDKEWQPLVREVIVQVGDVDEAVAFYRDACGFDHVRTQEEPAGRVAEMNAGGVRVTLVTRPAPGVLLALDTPDARAELRRLLQLDVEAVDEEPTATADGTWVGFRDPWGNRLGYFEERRGG
jgi:predicted enzyme related to lactoylglutathione lyase